MISYWVVMPAAGRGRRMGGELPKQYLRLAGRTVVEHALAPFLADPRCVGIVVALSEDDPYWPTLRIVRHPKLATVVGGAERRDSVTAGLEAVAERTGGANPWVLVHDAARPCLGSGDLDALLDALADEPDGALLAVPVADTLKRADADGRVGTTVPREALWRAQTPQAFRLERLRAALADGRPATDEASAVERAGGRPRLVRGSASNLKLTEPGDVRIAARLLGDEEGGGAAGETTTVGSYRIGFGTDVHAFGAGDHVWLGGVRIPHAQGVVAHSDGDVLLHALCDALLGAAGLGDIGQHFPDSDPRWTGAASTEFVRYCVALVHERGWAVVNADLTLLAEAPRVGPHRDEIRAHVAHALGVPVDAVNVKATTTEKLGFSGRREGLAAQAVVLLDRGG
ncbi:MAG: 2-C-methyl-D-erythritol 4-phosphate cytidylyltransferase [Steroidobacteraceae bacterium]|jgi:2-C-methyl-D-erythritol 4-phosphate cytidylyltransferase/2-C-methyl-D-erythritol 2,4-cyclodiphosphate synthase|nr:2-C-methyl-D-erythritol 4-phosphate cytidylyltransferase [Steroidobacteraceae bacterium]